MINRRKFIEQTGVLSAGMLLAKPDMLFAKPANMKVGLQLYSMRNYITKDVKDVIQKVAKAGYAEVETYDYNPTTNTYWGLSPKDFRSLLDDNGLTAPSGHFAMEQFLGSGVDTDLKKSIEAANIVGQKTIVIPHLGDKYHKTPDAMKQLAADINKMALICQQGGQKTGYHNHNTEFFPVDGVVMYDVLLQGTDPKLVGFQMDIYWVVNANRDPIQLIKQYPGRFNMWHIKDMDKVKRERNTEIGSGTIDFKKIFEYQKLSGLQHIYMEQENFDMDAYASITQSAAYIKNTLLK